MSIYEDLFRQTTGDLLENKNINVVSVTIPDEDHKQERIQIVIKNTELPIPDGFSAKYAEKDLILEKQIAGEEWMYNISILKILIALDKWSWGLEEY